MRWLAPSLVALALVFSTGGVAIVGHADPGAEPKADSQQSVDPGTCEAPPGFRRTGPAKPRVLKDAEGNKSIVLNTSGYNYVLDGEWRPNPLAVPQGVPDGVLPGDLPTPPASPEAK